MSTDVNTAVITWNAEHANAITELATLEATLKADYNKYIDSLAAYLERLQAANDIRQRYINILGIEDVSNDTKTRVEFIYSAKVPIENKATKYLLDTIITQETKSPVIVSACDAAKLLERKAV